MLKDVGCGVHMQAEITDTSRLYISVGLGFYPEVTLQEACNICSEKLKAIKQLVNESQQDLAKIEAHIELITDGLAGLRQLALTGS